MQPQGRVGPSAIPDLRVKVWSLATTIFGGKSVVICKPIIWEVNVVICNQRVVIHRQWAEKMVI